MRSIGFAALFKSTAQKAPVALLASALLLSACVETMTGQKAAEVAVPEQLVQTDPTIYDAKNAGRFNLPAVPYEQVPASHRRQIVDYPTEQLPGTIIIDPRYKLLYYVLGNGKAIRYGISVGAEGFQWSGEAIVSRKGEWPTWYPPKEMIARRPSLEKWANGGQPGGPTNPLGSRAIYLTSEGRDYGYRIHGSPEWQTIGRNASSGCFRMIQQDVLDLYERVKGGEKVIVLTANGELPKTLSIPKPIVPKKKAAPKVEAAPAAAEGVVAPAGQTGTDATASPADSGATTGTGTPATSAPATSAPATSAPVVTSPGGTSLVPSTGGASTLPAVNLPSVTAPDATAPSVTAPAVTAPSTPAPAATAPAATTPAAPATVAPSTPAPAATPAAPSCALPLVNGNCPTN